MRAGGEGSDGQLLSDGARPLVEGSPSMKLHELLDWGAIAGRIR